MLKRFWEKRYQENEYEWGLTANQTVLLAEKLLPAGSKILDLSCGYGRDALHLSRKGYQLVGLDISETAINRAKKLAAAEQLDIQFIAEDFNACTLADASFDAILVFNLLQMFDKRARTAMIEKMADLLKPSGTLILASFSVKDPEYGKGKALGNHSFQLSNNRIRSFYDYQSIREEFNLFDIKKLEQFSLAEHSHGNKNEHRHEEWLLVAKKRTRPQQEKQYNE